MESNETAAPKQTDEPPPIPNRTLSPEEKASLGFSLDSSLAIQKSLTSTLRQDLKFVRHDSSLLFLTKANVNREYSSNDRSCVVSETSSEPQSKLFDCTRTSFAGKEKRKMPLRELHTWSHISETCRTWR